VLNDEGSWGSCVKQAGKDVYRFKMDLGPMYRIFSGGPEFKMVTADTEQKRVLQT